MKVNMKGQLKRIFRGKRKNDIKRIDVGAVSVTIWMKDGSAVSRSYDKSFVKENFY